MRLIARYQLPVFFSTLRTASSVLSLALLVVSFYNHLGPIVPSAQALRMASLSHPLLTLLVVSFYHHLGPIRQSVQALRMASLSHPRPTTYCAPAMSLLVVSF